MSKALIIKGADFSTNKVTTISRGNDATLLYNGAEATITWTKNAPCGDVNYPTAITYVSTDTFFNFKTTQTQIFTVPENADSACFWTRLASAQAEGVEAATVAQSIGITIEFLTAE